jgi:hypothetical protein
LGSRKPEKRKPGTATKPNRHGLNTFKKAMMELGSRAIDGRSAYGKAVHFFEQQYIEDLGGESVVSAGQMQLIQMAAKTALLLSSVDCYIAELGSAIINKRNRCLFPIVLQRQQLADSHLRQLTALGLERRQKPIQSLQDYIAGKVASGV